MSNPPKCRSCGAELPADAPAGLCPKCLVKAGFQSGAGSQPNKPKTDPEAPTAASPTPSFAPPEIATLADKFPQLDILELLGFGGMGAVYQARQTNLDRLVALKIIRPEATHDPAFAERFNREAKTLARLSHQHIVAVHDFGEVEFSNSEDQPARPLYYFIMEYIDGANLRQLIRAGELSPQQALAIVPQICDALQYAHDEGVVHRDIKPENILLDKRGWVKIADFGLAKLANRSEAEFTLTGTQQVMGTLRYMAPEQMEGSHAVDHRADIYSLGVVFYEMLTGEAPMGHFEPPSKKVEVDVRLDEVVLRTLAREPERRYQRAGDVKTDVESISSSSLPAVTPIVRTPDARYEAAEPPRFSRKAIAGGVLAVMLFLTVTAAALFGVQAARSAGSATAGDANAVQFVGAIAALILLLCILSGPGSCLLGVVAINDIRHSQGRITGLGLAFFDAIFFPLILLDSVIVAMGLWINARVSGPDGVSPWTAILIGLAILVVDALILIPAWRTTACSINRKKGDNGSGSVDDTDQPERSKTSALASDIAQDADEQQRSAELAEIAPHWLCYPIMGLFAAGWIVLGLVWNFRWPGLLVAIGVLAGITYYVVKLKLRYLPKLQQELEREPRWSRGITITLALGMFVLAMLSLIAFQSTIGDFTTNISMLQRRTFSGLETDNEKYATVEKANIEGLTGDDVSLFHVFTNFPVFPVALMMYGIYASMFSLSAVAAIINTRRYRYTWKHWWGPSLSVVFYLLGMLIVVHTVHLFMLGYRSSRTDSREFRLRAGWDVVESKLLDWKKEKGYESIGSSESRIRRGELKDQVGQFHTHLITPESWFDRYQASWWHMVLRPQPPMYLTVVTKNEPAESYVRIELPHHAKDSPEEGLWMELVDDLEEKLVNAAAEEDAQNHAGSDQTKTIVDPQQGEQPSEPGGDSADSNDAARSEEGKP